MMSTRQLVLKKVLAKTASDIKYSQCQTITFVIAFAVAGALNLQ